MPSATWRTSTACGRSPASSASTVANLSTPSSRSGTDTLMPAVPTTTRMPVRTSVIGTVRTRRPGVEESTTSPQSISGFSTSCHTPSMFTRVSRFVVA